MATVVSHQAITSQRTSSNFKASHFLKEPLNVPIKLRQKRFKIQATASQAPLLDPVLSPSKTIPQSYKKKSSNRSAPFLLAPLIKKKHHWIIVFVLFRWSISDSNQAWRIVMEREESLHGLCWCSINRERCGWSYPSGEEDQQHTCRFDLHFFSHPCSDDCYACHDSTSLQEGCPKHISNDLCFLCVLEVDLLVFLYRFQSSYTMRVKRRRLGVMFSAKKLGNSLSLL